MNVKRWCITLLTAAATVLSSAPAATALTAPAPAPVPAPNSVTATSASSYLAGIKIGVWEASNNGGPALSATSGAVPTLQGAQPQIISYGVYDCWTTETCGDANAGQSHTGTLSQSSFTSQLSTIISDFNPGEIWITLPPVASGQICFPNGTNCVTGTAFCPPGNGTNWGMNLPMEKKIVDAIPASYTGSIMLESSNEGENACWSKWGFTGTGATGVSADLAKMYEATMPSLASYAQTKFPNNIVVPVAYIGVNGGTSRGSTTCSASGATFGYTCTVDMRWVSEFNTTLHNDGAAIPEVESVHQYCHSSDFATAPGAGYPYEFPDGVCLAFQRQWIKSARTTVSGIWGTTGNNMYFDVSEYQAGICNNYSSNCWGTKSDGKGFFSATAPGAYVSSYISMLAGNGLLNGATGTAYWQAVIFDDASNADADRVNLTNPSGNYNVVNENGSQGPEYAAYRAASCGC